MMQIVSFFVVLFSLCKNTFNHIKSSQMNGGFVNVDPQKNICGFPFSDTASFFLRSLELLGKRSFHCSSGFQFFVLVMLTLRARINYIKITNFLGWPHQAHQTN